MTYGEYVDKMIKFVDDINTEIKELDPEQDDYSFQKLRLINQRSNIAKILAKAAGQYKKAFILYGRHKEYCTFSDTIIGSQCTCGFNDVESMAT